MKIMNEYNPDSVTKSYATEKKNQVTKINLHESGGHEIYYFGLVIQNKQKILFSIYFKK